MKRTSKYIAGSIVAVILLVTFLTVLSTEARINNPAISAVMWFLNVRSFNGVLNASMFPGSDIGAKVNSAYTSLGSNGGTIVIPGSASYSFSTPILLNITNKKVWLKCDPNVILTYTGSNNTSAITFDTGVSATGGNDRSNQGIDGCYIKGPASNTGTTAIYIGGTRGANRATFRNNTIRDFGWGFKVGDNTYFDTWENNFVTANSSSWKFVGVTNSGENFSMFHNTWADCVLGTLSSPPYNPRKCFDTGANVGITITGDSFDDAELYVGPATKLLVSGGWFEAPAGAGIVDYDRIRIASSSGDLTTVNVKNSFFWVNNNSTTLNRVIRNGGNLILDGVTFSCSGCATRTRFVSQDTSSAGNTTLINVRDLNSVTTSCIDSGAGCNSFDFAKSTRGSWTAGMQINSSNQIFLGRPSANGFTIDVNSGTASVSSVTEFTGSATTSVQFETSSGTKGACLALDDVGGTGITYCRTKSGTMTCNTTPCR